MDDEIHRLIGTDQPGSSASTRLPAGQAQPQLAARCRVRAVALGTVAVIAAAAAVWAGTLDLGQTRNRGGGEVPVTPIVVGCVGLLAVTTFLRARRMWRAANVMRDGSWQRSTNTVVRAVDHRGARHRWNLDGTARWYRAPVGTSVPPELQMGDEVEWLDDGGRCVVLKAAGSERFVVFHLERTP